jgi:uncharacterized protein YkwD
MKRIAYLLLIAALFVLQACSSGGSGKPKQPSLAPPITASGPYNSSLAGAANTTLGNAALPPLCTGAEDKNRADFATEVIRLVNEERAKAGLEALTSQSQLADAAQKHSIDMGCKFFMDHTGSDGSSPFDRMVEFGYPYSTAAENVAAGFATPAEVMTGWMNSAGHRANILNADFTEIGIGYVFNPGDTTNSYFHYWTMTLGAQ